MMARKVSISAQRPIWPTLSFYANVCRTTSSFSVDAGMDWMGWEQLTSPETDDILHYHEE